MQHDDGETFFTGTMEGQEDPCTRCPEITFMEARGRARKWSDIDDNRLRELWISGARLTDIAKSLNRTREACGARTRRLKIEHNRPQRHRQNPKNHHFTSSRPR